MPKTEGGLDFKLELTHALDGYSGIKHSLPVVGIQSDVVELFKASQTTNSPTPLVSYGGPFGENWFYTHENPHENAKVRRFMPEEHLDWKTRRRGTNAGGHPGPAAWFVDEDYVHTKHAGFVKNLIEGVVVPPWAAMANSRAWATTGSVVDGLGWPVHSRCAAHCYDGAEAIGMSADIGTIEAGKFADILVLDRDPLADLRNTTSLRYVVKNGRVYNAETLDEVWPRERKLPAQYWQDVGLGGVRAGIR
jgi:hypothetical protein